MNSREYERLERRMKTRRKGIITSVIAGIVILAAIAVIILVIVSLGKKDGANGQADATTAVTEQPTLYVPTQKSTSSATSAETSAQQYATYAQSATSGDQQSATQSGGYDTVPPTSASGSWDPQDVTSKPHYPLPLPEAEAGALHYQAYGKTSQGYNWTYSSTGAVVNITCTYNFTKQMYDFTISGTSPGTTSFTLVYYKDDNQPVNVPMTVSVDDNLNVTQIG